MRPAHGANACEAYGNLYNNFHRIALLSDKANALALVCRQVTMRIRFRPPDDAYCHRVEGRRGEGEGAGGYAPLDTDRSRSWDRFGSNLGSADFRVAEIPK